MTNSSPGIWLPSKRWVFLEGDSAEDNGAPRSGDYPMPPFPFTYSDQQFSEAASTLNLKVTATPQARVSDPNGFQQPSTMLRKRLLYSDVPDRRKV